MIVIITATLNKIETININYRRGYYLFYFTRSETIEKLGFGYTNSQKPKMAALFVGPEVTTFFPGKSMIPTSCSKKKNCSCFFSNIEIEERNTLDLGC